jgi:hypothetical protein
VIHGAQAAWADALTAGLDAEDLRRALATMEELLARLDGAAG